MTSIDWPHDISAARFKPARAAEMTGVTTGMQRLWASKGYDFRLLQAEGSSVHRPWDWYGCQTLAVFAEAMANTKDFSIASAMAAQASTLAMTDLRGHADGDVLIWWNATNAEAQADVPSSFATAFAYANIDVRPRTTFLVNFSAIQRQLFETVRIAVTERHS